MPHYQPQTRVPDHHRQEGVVLIIALIMLAIMAVASSLALKSVTTGDLIGNNLRVQQLTQQSAEAALRWCETQVIANSGVVAVADAATDPTTANAENWQTLGNWQAASAVPVNVIQIAGGPVFAVAPQCLAQWGAIAPSTVSQSDLAVLQASARRIRITVRGFSPDYSRGAGRGSGSEVWILSTLINPV
jgi:type IV pilus assembly protein PilX